MNITEAKNTFNDIAKQIADEGGGIAFIGIAIEVASDGTSGGAECVNQTLQDGHGRAALLHALNYYTAVISRGDD